MIIIQIFFCKKTNVISTMKINKSIAYCKKVYRIVWFTFRAAVCSFTAWPNCSFAVSTQSWALTTLLSIRSITSPWDKVRVQHLLRNSQKCCDSSQLTWLSIKSAISTNMSCSSRMDFSSFKMSLCLASISANICFACSVCWIICVKNNVNIKYQTGFHPNFHNVSFLLVTYTLCEHGPVSFLDHFFNFVVWEVTAHCNTELVIFHRSETFQRRSSFAFDLYQYQDVAWSDLCIDLGNLSEQPGKWSSCPRTFVAGLNVVSFSSLNQRILFQSELPPPLLFEPNVRFLVKKQNQTIC